MSEKLDGRTAAARWNRMRGTDTAGAEKFMIATNRYTANLVAAAMAVGRAQSETERLAAVNRFNLVRVELEYL